MLPATRNAEQLAFYKANWGYYQTCSCYFIISSHPMQSLHKEKGRVHTLDAPLTSSSRMLTDIEALQNQAGSSVPIYLPNLCRKMVQGSPKIVTGDKQKSFLKPLVNIISHLSARIVTNHQSVDSTGLLCRTFGANRGKLHYLKSFKSMAPSATEAPATSWNLTLSLMTLGTWVVQCHAHKRNRP